MNKLILLFILCFYSSLSFANLYLNIGIVHKKGINKGLILKNELHSLDEVRGNEFIVLKMKDGVEFFLSAKYVIDQGVYGPSDTIFMEAELLDKKGKKLKLAEDSSFIIKLGEKKMLSSSGITDQLIEITITPEIHK
ncbi:MAG: hypothetical protein DRQ88_04510 [Epsilonproteobacteria bacterium]|nr:MAG: hypothetical protein DRQ89_07445 [Campylobacterota bacterium]RLA67020.1 MAG: hypothetical protein DRQ88_04510 [Campylobacterota bacterium]